MTSWSVSAYYFQISCFNCFILSSKCLKYRATDRSALRDTERFLEGTMAGICGVTEEELVVQRGNYIEEFLVSFGILKQIFQKLQKILKDWARRRERKRQSLEQTTVVKYIASWKWRSMFKLFWLLIFKLFNGRIRRLDFAPAIILSCLVSCISYDLYIFYIIIAVISNKNA